MQIIHTTPLLEADTSTGTLKYWQGIVLADTESQAYTQSRTYSTNDAGVSSKEVYSTPKRIHGKNGGRRNATSSVEQAILEIESLARAQKDKGYAELGAARTTPWVRPMLAHSFSERGKDIRWPAFVQPKLDGTRMLSNGQQAWTRLLKPYNDDVVAHLRCDLPEGVVLDGEIMLDQNQYSFQETIRAIKKFRPETSPALVYHVYDLADSTRPFEERYEQLRSIVDQLANPQIVLVETHKVHTQSESWEWHDRFVERGFEGAILRNAQGYYKPGHRTIDLQKLKTFQDTEFTIVDVIEGEAKEEGLAIFICATADGSGIFEVRPKGTYEERRQWWERRESFVGKQLTTQHFGYTEAGKPRFPVGIAVRDYE